jgi:hypothetical protein
MPDIPRDGRRRGISGPPAWARAWWRTTVRRRERAEGGGEAAEICCREDAAGREEEGRRTRAVVGWEDAGVGLGFQQRMWTILYIEFLGYIMIREKRRVLLQKSRARISGRTKRVGYSAPFEISFETAEASVVWV